MKIRIKKNDISLIIAFMTILFWDLIEQNFPNFQFVILGLLLIYNIGRIKKYINGRFVLIFTIIFLHGTINCILGNNRFTTFIIQLGSIIVSYLAFSCAIDKCKYRKIFGYYWKTAFIMSIFGCLEIFFSMINASIATRIPLLFINTTFTSKVVGVFPRIAALCNEPSFLGYFLAPAVFLIVYSFINKKSEYITFNEKKRFIQAICILTVYLMTFSTVSYMGLIFMFIIIWLDKGISWQKIIIPILAVFCVLFLYIKVPDFKMRVDDTYNIFFQDNSDTGSINLSSYTYYANFNVVDKSIRYTYGLGTGLGSYRYLFDMYNIGAWGNSGLNLNREDGNSMMFRVGAELGIFGILGICVFLLKYLPRDKEKKVFAYALLSLFFMIIMRMGNYTHGGIWLYIVLYIKLFRECNNRKLAENRKSG